MKQFNAIFFSVNTNSSTIELVSSGVQLISSPGYPRYYPSYTQKAFFIVAPEGYTIKLNVLDFDIRSGCSYNRISIYDGIFRILKFILSQLKHIMVWYRMDVDHFHGNVFFDGFVCPQRIESFCFPVKHWFRSVFYQVVLFKLCVKFDLILFFLLYPCFFGFRGNIFQGHLFL